jgi:hypothetical protein
MTCSVPDDRGSPTAIADQQQVCRPDELASPLVFAERYHVSQGFHLSEVITEADKFEHFLFSRGLRKVKDLQSLLWDERGACRIRSPGDQAWFSWG